MNNEPVAYVNSMCNDYIDWKADPMSIDGQPLYTHLVKELDEQFKKGFEAGKEEGWKAHKFHHPVKEQDTDCQYCKQGCIRCDARKQLTDEEIRHIQAICHLKDVGYDNFIMRFARAILRKAQEK